MSLTEIIHNWLYVLLGIVAIWLVLYFARRPAHKAIHAFCRVLRNGLRLMGKSTMLAEEKLRQRNKEVLLTAGKEAVERVIEREFHRVNSVVQRDLSGFPVLQRSLAEQTARIDEDYQTSSELTPAPPGWITAVEAIAKIPDSGHTSVANILREIHKTTTIQFKTIMDEYRKAVANHHTILNKMVPHWRKLSQTLDEVDKTITGLHERSRRIDNRMEEYEEIRSKSDKAERLLTSSSLTQFFIAGFVLLIAIWGALINFHLIALPMSEMVGGGSYIYKFKTADVAALVIILVEVAMGLYLMESLRITRLFPIIGQMDDKMRIRMGWITLCILVILASIESSLAFMRDQIAANNQALIQSLSGQVSEVLQPTSSLIPTIGQMVMGFILPFVLAFVAIPLESFVHSLRTVIGVLAVVFLRVIAFLLRLSGNIIHNSGYFIVNSYDLLIFPALWAENKIMDFRKNDNTAHKEEAL